METGRFVLLVHPCDELQDGWTSYNGVVTGSPYKVFPQHHEVDRWKSTADVRYDLMDIWSGFKREGISGLVSFERHSGIIRPSLFHYIGLTPVTRKPGEEVHPGPLHYSSYITGHTTESLPFPLASWIPNLILCSNLLTIWGLHPLTFPTMTERVEFRLTKTTINDCT